ncbi:MAG: hypothetical protein ACRED8_07240, partial [Caulobacteraceae bacterium]
MDESLSLEAEAPPLASRAAPPKRRMKDVLASIRRPKIAIMLFLGLSSGLPFMLFGNTLGFWLAEDKVSL